LGFDLTAVDTSHLVVGEEILDGLEGVSAVGLTAECSTDFLQDAPSKSRGERQAEVFERVAFVEVCPHPMRRVSNPVEMGWCQCPSRT
jgi:hypothetical protein